MKPKSILILLAVFIPVILITIFLWKPFSSHDSFNLPPDIDKYIKVKSPIPDVIVVSMGFDAVTAIKTLDGIVVIDAGICKKLTSEYRKVIEKKFNSKDFKYLINTHSHADHIGGNRVFSDAKIVGQENIIKESDDNSNDAQRAKANLHEIVDEYETELSALKPGTPDREEVYCQMIRYECALSELSDDSGPPSWDITFKDSLDINMEGVSLDMIWTGNAHSGSDIIIFVPEKNLLLTGDLFFPGGRPSIGNLEKPDYKQLEKTVRWIKTRLDQINTVIGGHGQIMSREDLEAFLQNCEADEQEQKQLID